MGLPRLLSSVAAVVSLVILVAAAAAAAAEPHAGKVEIEVGVHGVAPGIRPVLTRNEKITPEDGSTGLLELESSLGAGPRGERGAPGTDGIAGEEGDVGKQ